MCTQHFICHTHFCCCTVNVIQSFTSCDCEYQLRTEMNCRDKPDTTRIHLVGLRYLKVFPYSLALSSLMHAYSYSVIQSCQWTKLWKLPDISFQAHQITAATCQLLSFLSYSLRVPMFFFLSYAFHLQPFIYDILFRVSEFVKTNYLNFIKITLLGENSPPQGETVQCVTDFYYSIMY